MRGTLRNWAGAIAAGAVLAALVAGCGAATDDASTQDQIRQARADGARQARDAERLRQLERRVRNQEKGGKPSPSSGGRAPAAPASPKSCGGGLSAGSNTTCTFAANVRAAYYELGGSGGMTVTAYSPATDRSYEMSCTGATTHVCRGGNSASVYFP